MTVNLLAQDSTTTWTEAWIAMLGVGVLLVAAGFLVVGLAERGADGRLGLNGSAGIRTKATMASDEAWLAAHQAGRGLSVAGGWVMILGAPLAVLLAVLFSGDSAERAVFIWGVVIGVMTVATLVSVVLGAVKGNRAAKDLADKRP